MVVTLERRSKLLKHPDDNGVRFDGGISVLTGELGMKLYDSYLDEIGWVTFLRKIEEGSFDAADLDHVVDFLVHHGIQPTKDNAFRLMMGARVHLLLANRREKGIHNGQKQG